MKKATVVLFVLLIFISNKTTAREAKQLKSWKDLRDYKVIRQERDFSCGIASLATVLQLKFNVNVSEEALIEQLNRMKKFTNTSPEGIRGYSMLDIKRLAESLGYRGKGLALNYDGLKRIVKPVIVYIEPRGVNHFSVVTKVDENFVYLADPSWGNVKYVREKFIEIWKTRNDPIYYGRVLLIGPQN